MSAGPAPHDLIRLFPATAGAELIGSREAYSKLVFGADPPANRPYVIVNMVATADGQGRIGGDTSELGDDADAALFATLRERVDCVMAGIGTIGIEQYNAPATKPEVQARRVAAGLAPRPIVATVTRGGDLPTEAPIFADPELKILVFSDAELNLDGVAAQTVQVHTTEPKEILTSLRHVDNVNSLLLEGGPHLNTPFFADELVDELFLSVAPVLTGNNDPFPIIAGPLPAPQKLHLIGALSGNEHLFLRYRVD
jgi:riboflavin biosynthesis pyrimidine reductase